MRSRYFALDLSMGYFSFFAGNVLSASLSILFAFYKSAVVIKRKFVSVSANLRLAAVFLKV